VHTTATQTDRTGLVKTIPASYWNIGALQLRVQEYDRDGVKQLLIRADTPNSCLGFDLDPQQAIEFANALTMHARQLGGA
jgi:hypothetical protein